MEEMTADQIRSEGLEALKRETGTVGMVRFLQQFDCGRGDYAVDRHEWQGQIMVEDVLAQIDAAQRGNME